MYIWVLPLLKICVVTVFRNSRFLPLSIFGKAINANCWITVTKSLVYPDLFAG